MDGLAADRSTDVFAVGIVLWELLAGRRLSLAESSRAPEVQTVFRELLIASIKGRGME